MKKRRKLLVNKILYTVSATLFVISLIFLVVLVFGRVTDAIQLKKQNERLQSLKEYVSEQAVITDNANTVSPIEKEYELKMLDVYNSMHYMNSDLVGWLKVEGTKIDYPVLQTPEDEDYYLSYDFMENKNQNGSLILDSDSNPGVGIKENSYLKGNPPSTNLIVHGHAMKNGEMFGELHLYSEETYGKEHSVIHFDSLYEEREYEVISVFYSKVYNEDEDVFKYYNFFEAKNEAEFDDWYSNIKELALYDTGVEAVYGDEFITLSACAYQEKNGRFVVVGKRIK